MCFYCLCFMKIQISRLDRKYKQRTAAHFKVAENKIKIHTYPNRTWNNLEYPPSPRNSNSHIDVKPKVGWVRHERGDFDNQIPNPWENIFSQKYQSSPSSGKQRSVVHLKKLQMYSSWGHHVQIKSLLMGQPCNQILVGSLTPLGLSIDRCINILYCCSKFKALYMMGVDIFLYVEEGIKQLCKNFFFNLFSISFFNIFPSCWVEELGQFYFIE